MRLGILCSGNLGRLVLDKLDNSHTIIFVMTDKKSVDIVELCNKKKIAIFLGNPREGKASDFIHNKEIDVLISINYLYIIDKELITLPKKIAFNIHGSLLPKYRGRTPHVWAIINNEKETGITAHKIDEGCDTGDIIKQITVPIKDIDTGADILNKYNQLYIPFVYSILNDISLNKIQFLKQDHSKATYFGKRTPEDGKIDWNWQKERIYNWIRAQAFPYPGAFTFIKGKKIIIDEISFSDFGYQDSITNGQILKISPVVLVKAPNGVVELSKIRNLGDISFEIHEKTDYICQ